MQYDKLRGRIIEKYGTLGNFGKALNKDSCYVSRYLKNHSTFSQDTILKWSEALDIDTSEVGVYFFAKRID